MKTEAYTVIQIGTRKQGYSLLPTAAKKVEEELQHQIFTVLVHDDARGDVVANGFRKQVPYKGSLSTIQKPEALHDLLKDNGLHVGSRDLIIPGSDQYIGVAHELVRHLGLEQEKLNSRFTPLNKVDQSICFDGNVPRPPSDQCDVTNHDDLKKKAAIIGYPVVIKSPEFCNAVGVYLARSEVDLINHAARIQNLNGFEREKPSVLLEKYIEGSEYTIQGVVYKGEIYPGSISKKGISFYPDFFGKPGEERQFRESRHTGRTPDPQGRRRHALIMDAVQKAVTHEGLENGAFSSDIRVDKEKRARVLEISARPAGSAPLNDAVSDTGAIMVNWLKVLKEVEPQKQAPSHRCAGYIREMDHEEYPLAKSIQDNNDDPDLTITVQRPVGSDNFDNGRMMVIERNNNADKINAVLEQVVGHRGA